MIDPALRAEIAAAVHQDARQHGAGRIVSARIAARFRRRAAWRDLREAVRREIAAVRSGAGQQDQASPMAMTPLAMIECTPRRMRLTVAGCARLWLSAQEAHPAQWEGRAACVACPIGARNAGFSPSPVAGLVDALSHVCARCLKKVGRVINGRFCISCYNRHAEAMRGRNARGSRPRLCDQLSAQRIALATGNEITISVDQHAVSATETLIFLARQATQPTAFGWAPAGPGHVVELA